MKNNGIRLGVRLAALLLLAFLCVLACAGCELTSEENTEPEATTTAATTLPPVSEPTIADGVTPVKTAAEASVSLNPTGIRFGGSVDKTYYDALVATYGEKNVKVGVLVAPTAANGSVNFTGEGVAKARMSAVEADGDEYVFNGVLTGLAEKDYTVKYAAAAYVEVCGTVLRTAEASNSFSLVTAAEASLNDLTNTRDAKHPYVVTIDGANKYSPYNNRQREIISELRFPCAITVMSYNIEVYDSKKGWEGRTPSKALATVIEESPDIVGFQEVNSPWNEMLDNFANGNGYTRLKGSPTTDNFEKNEIFFKTDKFTLIEEGTKIYKSLAAELNVPNTESADNSRDTHGRAFHYAILEQKETGKKILVVNTHLHYNGTGDGFEEDDKVRRYEINTLLAWLGTKAAAYPNQLVMGDMNSHYKGNKQGSVNMALFTTAGYLRTSDLAATVGDVGGTLANSHTTRPQYIFDYILVKGNIGTKYYTVVDNPIDGGNYPSDHIPIKATISLLR